MDLRTQLLDWIKEETERFLAEKRLPAIPIHLLLVKMALANRGDEQSVSASVELSLQIFDRAAVFRQLREMRQEGLLSFTDREGTELTVDEKELGAAASGESTSIKYVMLRS